jgi:hypothetical protein
LHGDHLRNGDRVNETELEAWLERYGLAWENRDPEAAAALFSEDVKYYETPFIAPAQGRDGVREYWSHATRNQSDIRFSHDIVSVSAGLGIARWWVEYRRLSSDVLVRLDGIFLLRFDDRGLCRELREWWHKSETRPEGV